MKTKLLLAFLFLNIIALAQCPMPINVTITHNTGTSADISWTETGDATEWEVVVEQASQIPPGIDYEGIVTTVQTFSVVDLACYTSYRVHVRSICGVDKSAWETYDFISGLCGDMCIALNTMQVTGQTSNMSTITWSSGSNERAEFLIQLATDAAPTASDWPTVSTDFSPYPLNIPECVESQLWFRTECPVDLEWQGPIMLRPVTMGASIGTLYGCSANGLAFFNMSDAVPILPSGNVTIYSTLVAAINQNNEFLVGTDTTPGLELAPSESQNFYVRLDNAAGCDTIYPLVMSVDGFCDGISVEAFLDTNSNGIKDTGEANFPAGYFTYSKNGGPILNNYNQHGAFFIYEPNVTDIYDFEFHITPSYETEYSCGTTFTNIAHTTGITTLRFPVIATEPYVDAGVVLVSSMSPMPGFAMQETISYTNYGSEPIISGTLAYSKDEAIAALTISEAAAITNASGFTLNFTNLMPFETRSVTIEYTMPFIPAVQLGQLMHSSVIVSALADDFQLNNQSGLVQTIIGSFDPNDKTEAHGANILHSEFSQNEFLRYIIRFENTGTAPAYNIRIEDVLDSQLDATTVELLASSHNTTISRDGQSLTFNLPNVMLPPSVENTQIGHGYVQFRVKPISVSLGDVIPNTASIYFDFNPAIITPNWTTTFVSQLFIDENQTVRVVVYPNPVNDVLTINVDNATVKSATVRDITGKIVDTVLSSDRIDLKDVASGLYFLEVETDHGQKLTRKIIKN